MAQALHRADTNYTDRLHTLWPSRAIRNNMYGTFFASLTVTLAYEAYQEFTIQTEQHQAIGSAMLLAAGVTGLTTVGMYQTAFHERNINNDNCGLDILDQEYSRRKGWLSVIIDRLRTT